MQPHDCGFCSNNWYILKQHLWLQYGVKQYGFLCDWPLEYILPIFRSKIFSLSQVHVVCLLLQHLAFANLPFSKVYNGFDSLLNEHSYFYATAIANTQNNCININLFIHNFYMKIKKAHLVRIFHPLWNALAAISVYFVENAEMYREISWRIEGLLKIIWNFKNVQIDLHLMPYSEHNK